MQKLPEHSNQAENPSPMHELSHSRTTLGGKTLAENLHEALFQSILEKLLIM